MTTEQPKTFQDGSLIVVEKLCSFAADRSKANVVIESEGDNFPSSIEELSSMNSRNLALQFAASSGVSSPGINGMSSGPYAVNSEGIPLDELKDETGKPLPPTHIRARIHRYRIEIPIARNMR